MNCRLKAIETALLSMCGLWQFWTLRNATCWASAAPPDYFWLGILPWQWMSLLPLLQWCGALCTNWLKIVHKIHSTPGPFRFQWCCFHFVLIFKKFHKSLTDAIFAFSRERIPSLICIIIYFGYYQLHSLIFCSCGVLSDLKHVCQGLGVLQREVLEDVMNGGLKLHCWICASVGR